MGSKLSLVQLENCKAPGFLVTVRRFCSMVLEAGFRKKMVTSFVRSPKEVASLALHLCGPESGWTTGSIISIDGGQTAA